MHSVSQSKWTIVINLSYFVLPYVFVKCLVSCRADINVTDYVFWTKDGINQWHTFFPTRAIKEELLTIVTAKKVLLPDIRRDLKKIITFQYQELKTAKKVMEGTDAKGCVRGLSRFLYQAVQKGESKKFIVCKYNIVVINFLISLNLIY